MLRKELDERLGAAGADPEWADIVRDLDRVEEVTVDQATKRFVLRVQAPAAPVSSARPLVSRCRRSSASCRRRIRRPGRRHRQRAADGHAVVPRVRNFPELPRQINKLTIQVFNFSLSVIGTGRRPSAISSPLDHTGHDVGHSHNGAPRRRRRASWPATGRSCGLIGGVTIVHCQFPGCRQWLLP